MNKMPTEIVVQIMERADALTARQLSLSCSRFREIFVAFRTKMRKEKEVRIVIRFEATAIGFKCVRNKSHTEFNNLDAEGLKEIVKTAEMYYKFDVLVLTGNINDQALELLLEYMNYQKKIKLRFSDCEIAITKMTLWSKFLGMVRPICLGISRAKVSVTSLFPQDVIETALINVEGINIEDAKVSHHSNITSEIENLLQLPLAIMFVDAQFKFNADKICAMLERWIRGKLTIRNVDIAYYSEDHDRLVQFVNQIPGHDVGTLRYCRVKQIRNENGVVREIRLFQKMNTLIIEGVF